MNVLIIGGGRTGSHIAKLLKQAQINFTIIDNRKKVINQLLLDFDPSVVIEGNGTETIVLEQAGIEKADVVVAASGKDEVNLLIATITKFEYGINRVIARINNPRNAWLFDEKMGVDTAVNQADILSHIVTEEINLESLSTLLKFNRDNLSIVQVNVSNRSRAIDKTIEMLELPINTVLISIIRNEAVLVATGSTTILAGDKILAVTQTSNQSLLKEVFD